MKLKKILFIIAACVLTFAVLLDFITGMINFSFMRGEYHADISTQYLCGAIQSLIPLGDLALLAVVDFLCCAAVKNYNKKMFGIAIAIFSVWTLRLVSMYIVGYWVAQMAWRYYYAAVAISCIYVFPVLAAQLGLSIAYLRAKKKFHARTKE